MIELRRRNSVKSAPSGSRLPKGYQEVEWIGTEVTNQNQTPFLNTGVIINDNNFSITLDYEATGIIPDSAGDTQWICGSFGVNLPSWRLWYRNGLRIYENMPAKDILISAGIDKHKRKTVIINNSGVWIDNKNIYSGSINMLSDLEFGILGVTWKQGSNYAMGSSQKGYSCLIEHDGVLIRHLIPCYRISDRKPGMYDIVNDVFYTNAGTGEFLVGPDVGVNTILPTEYQQVEYIDNSNNPNAYLVIPEIKIGYVGTITGEFYIESIDIQNVTYPYKFAFGWNDGPQCVIKVTDKMYFHNWNTSSIIAQVKTKYNLKLEIDNYNSELYVDNIFAVSNSTFNTSEGLVILNNNHRVNGLFGRIYNLKSDGTVNINLIPCYRKTDTVAGMYDIVEGKFYTNAGTGVFIVGPDIVD